jgi:hypothetical protein
MKISLIPITLMLMASARADSSVGVGSFTVTKDSGTSDASTPKTIYKPAVTRTELKVSRSLNPDAVQTLNVRTNNGGLATIIVKKRDGKTSVNNEPRQAYYDVSNQFSRGEVRRGMFGPIHLDDAQVQKLQQQQSFENGRVYNNWANPQPVTTLHQSQLYHRSPYESYRFSPPSPNDQKSVNLINSFMKHVQSLEGGRQIRSPDGSMPNDRAQVHTKIPEPVTINSESVYVKDQANNGKKGRSLMEIGADGIPLINGIRVPDDENDKRQTWRNARVINGELVPYETGYVPPRTVEYGQLIYPVKKNFDEIQSRKKSIGPFSKSDNFSEEEEQDSNKSIGPFSVTDMFTSRSSQHMSDDGNIGPFSVADNSRASNSKLIDYIKRINDHEYRKDYFAGRSPKETNGQQKIQRRMLTQPANAYFPPSSRYSVNKPSDSDPAGGPVLQYAHPEFGLQSAGSAYEEQQQKSNKPATKVEYYTNSYQQRPNNNQPLYQIEPAQLNTREYYNYQKAPATYPYNYGFIRRVKPERPFWVKISEQMRDTFQNGFSQVHEIAKPVMQPIMEAGEKISQNLGFSYAPNNQAQEKISSALIPAHGTSYIFPALGMLAGGAALGLGAVAMGRIFDVGTLLSMRSAEDTQIDHHPHHKLEIEHKRALEAIHKAPTTTLFLVEDHANEINSEKSQRSKTFSNDSIEIYATPTASPKAKFLELIAIPYRHSSVDSSIDPSSEPSPMTSHQRRKRNK